MGRVKVVTLTYHFGDTFDDYAVLWVDGNDLAIDLTGYTATFRVKTAPGGSQVLELTSPSGGLSITALTGRIDFNATPTKMTSGTLVEGTVYSYDLQVATAASADVKTLIKGEFWVDPEVTDV